MTPPRWTLTDIAYTITAAGVEVVVTTDIPCHLWMRETTEDPHIHKKAILIRGLRVRDDVRFCFTVFEDNEQAEAGDTLTHTFLKEPWPVCETRYFYFHGTIGGAESPSTTAIFTYHRIAIPTTAFFYPDKHPEATSVDGYVERVSPLGQEPWADIHDGAGTGSGDSTGQNYMAIRAWRRRDNYEHLQRIIILFDTSSIPLGKTILSAELRVKCFSVNIPQRWAAFSAVVVPSTPADDFRIVNADYQELGTAQLSNVINRSVFSAGSHTTFILNSAGRAAITLGGITRLGIREDSFDRANILPPWIRLAWDRIALWSADTPDLDNTPRLKVTYE